MKIGKKGKVKLGLSDLRVGNFVYSLESGHIKCCDIAGVMSLRISTSIPKGQMMEYAFREAKKGDEKKRAYLEGHAAVFMNACCAVPCVDHDEDGNVVFNYLDSINRVACECVDRHPDVYGIVKDIKDEDDAVILEGERSLAEVEAELREELSKE